MRANKGNEQEQIRQGKLEEKKREKVDILVKREEWKTVKKSTDVENRGKIEDWGGKLKDKRN